MADVSVEEDSCPLDVSLVRGAPLRVLLRRGGDVFKTSEGTAESYGLSSQVSHVDTFVSHTWRTPKTKKFMALSLHFNFAIAYVSALFIGLVVSTLGGFRVLPFMELEPFGTIPRVPCAPVGLCLCPLVFWLVLFLCRDIVLPVPVREHQVFLDKVCVHLKTVLCAGARKFR